MADLLLGGVEGGGTKFLAAVARYRDGAAPEIIDRLRIDTTDPAATLGRVAEWLAAHDLAGLGIATFGPLDLETGRVRDTPKPGWSGADVVATLSAAFDAPPPIAFDTDVNGAGLGEWRWGAAQGSRVALYLTVGTGIGGGAIIDGRPLHGLGHPEMGHISVPRHPDDDHATLCALHATCLEGMASGRALEARGSRPGDHLGDGDPRWEFEIHYLAHGLSDLTLVLSPEVIVIGGGVMQRPELLKRVSDRLDEILDGYVDTPQVTHPHFGQEAGLMGALALASLVARH
jgi:fructokinase